MTNGKRIVAAFAVVAVVGWLSWPGRATGGASGEIDSDEIGDSAPDPTFQDADEVPPETTCDDFTDNDADGLIDCGDSDCIGLACNDMDDSTVNDLCVEGMAGGLCIGDLLDAD